MVRNINNGGHGKVQNNKRIKKGIEGREIRKLVNRINKLWSKYKRKKRIKNENRRQGMVRNNGK